MTSPSKPAEEKNTASKGVIALQEKLGWITEDKHAVYTEKWDEIRAILADAPTPGAVKDMLDSIALPLADFEALYDEGKRADAILYAKDLKARYSVLWLYHQIK